MKVLFVANEVAPYAKVGGLADVAGSLPQALARRDLEVRVVMPLHRQCLEHGELDVALEALPVRVGDRTIKATVLEASPPSSDVPVYFIQHDPYFDRAEVYGEGGSDYLDAPERYAFFARAALALTDALGFEPDILHANDWPTGLVPLFAAESGRQPATVYTIHNLGYQGQFPSDVAETIGVGQDAQYLKAVSHNDAINFMAGGIRAATIVSTVSERYAQEIQTPQFGCGLERLLQARSRDLHGVLNGIDYHAWNPSTDEALPANFSAQDTDAKAKCKAELQREMRLPLEPEAPLVGCVTRLAWQKGLDLLAEVIPAAIKLPMQFVLLGTGEEDIEDACAGLDATYPRAVAAAIRYDDALARRIYAGSDLFVMPSRYEPCGLGQMIAMAYGAIPIVHATGGLADTVRERGKPQTGFVFEKLTAQDLLAALKRAVAAYRVPTTWRDLRDNAMAQDFSWADSARRYEELYDLARFRAKAQLRKVG